MEHVDLIRMRGITKTFGSLAANDEVDFSVRCGEVHAILGENGAGKSTLMNILSGIYLPDSGSIEIAGVPAVFHSPQDSIGKGIGMIYQHFKLIDSMTAWQNICAGPKGSLMLHPREYKQQITKLCEQTGLELDLDARVRDMGVGQKQTLEIVKVLYRGASILILDEPTTVLTPQETDRLFSIIRGMRDAGKTAIIITHKLYEVMEISDRVTVMRKGRAIKTVDTKSTSQKELAELMVGKSLSTSFEHVPQTSEKQIALRLEEVSMKDPAAMRSLHSVSLELFRGEILGIAGVSGSGQKQLCESIVGLQSITSGHIYAGDSEITGMTSFEASKKGIVRIGYVPEDRVGMGLAAKLSLVDNVMLRDYRTGKGIKVDRKRATEMTERLVESLEVMHPGVDRPISVLSGGNLQKVLLGREIMTDPDILIAAYPVRGLDLGVTHKVIALLNEQKQQGRAVLMIAEDLDLLLEVCDRIAVMYCGRVSGVVDPKKTTKRELGLLMSSIDKECEHD